MNLLIAAILIGQITVSPGDDIQAAFDLAVEDPMAIQEVKILPGRHWIKEVIVAKCPVRGIGKARLEYVGEQTDKPLLTVRGKAGATRRPSVTDLFIAPHNKSAGLLVDHCHDITVERVRVHQSVGYGLRVVKGWAIEVRNVRVAYSKGKAFDLHNFTASFATGLHAHRVTGKGPILFCGGQSLLQQISIEDCSSTEQPLVLLHGFLTGELSGLWGERNEAPVQIECRDSSGATIERVRFSQEPELPGRVGVSLVGCRGIDIGAIEYKNFSDVVLRIGPECRDITYSRERLVNPQRELPESKWRLVVFPQHIVEVLGRGSKGE